MPDWAGNWNCVIAASLTRWGKTLSQVDEGFVVTALLPQWARRRFLAGRRSLSLSLSLTLSLSQFGVSLDRAQSLQIADWHAIACLWWGKRHRDLSFSHCPSLLQLLFFLARLLFCVKHWRLCESSSIVRSSPIIVTRCPEKLSIKQTFCPPWKSNILWKGKIAASRNIFGVPPIWRPTVNDNMHCDPTLSYSLFF